MSVEGVTKAVPIAENNCVKNALILGIAIGVIGAFGISIYRSGILGRLLFKVQSMPAMPEEGFDSTSISRQTASANGTPDTLASSSTATMQPNSLNPLQGSGQTSEDISQSKSLIHKAFDLTAVESRSNKRIDPNGVATTGNHKNQDRVSKKQLGDNFFLWAVFDGHGGSQVSDRASNHFHTYCINLPISGDISKAIQQAYKMFNNDFFEKKSENIEKLRQSQKTAQDIKNANPGMKNYELILNNKDFQNCSNVIASIQTQLAGGSTACTLLAVENDLIAANIGDSRIVLVSQPQSELKVEQLSVDHNTSNENELNRLEKINLNKDEIRKNKRVGTSQVTRSFGDYDLSLDWKNVDILKNATSAPVICAPDVSMPIKLTSDHKFAFLMSDGVYDAVSEFKLCNTQDANRIIAEQINTRLNQKMPIKKIAEKVLDWIETEQKEARKKGNENCRRLDDLTLMIVPLTDCSSQDLI